MFRHRHHTPAIANIRTVADDPMLARTIWAALLAIFTLGWLWGGDAAEISAQDLTAASPNLSQPFQTATESPLWSCPDDESLANPDCRENPDWLPQPGDEIWLVNTRGLANGISDCNLAPQLPVSRWQNGQFKAASLPELLEVSAQRPTVRNVTYIHGNFTDYNWSVRRGLEVYSHCFGQSGNRQPVRFIIWSWRSERETLLPRDYQIKSQRAVSEGSRVHSLVSQLGPQPPIVIGYSLGAQATLSALAQPGSAEENTWTVTLIAAALDPHFCSTLRNNQEISRRVERLVLFTNHVDPALNCSRRITRRTSSNPNPPSQYSIIPQLRGGQASLEQFEVSHEVGHHHAISRYLGSPTVSSHLRALVEPLSAATSGSIPPESTLPATSR